MQKLCAENCVTIYLNCSMSLWASLCSDMQWCWSRKVPILKFGETHGSKSLGPPFGANWGTRRWVLKRVNAAHIQERGAARTIRLSAGGFGPLSGVKGEPSSAADSGLSTAGAARVQRCTLCQDINHNTTEQLEPPIRDAQNKTSVFTCCSDCVSICGQSC